VGITAFVDASPTNDTSRRKLFLTYMAKGLIPQRVVMMMGREAISELDPRDASPLEQPDAGVAVWGMKLILDRTTGSLHPSQTELNEIVLEAQGRGWPVAIHAVEEETIQAALEALEAAIAHRPPNLRLHIEHGSVCPPHLARRMAALGVTVTTQPSFLYYFGERYLRSVKPEQLPHLYPLGTWLRSGVPVAGSSDCPMVPPAPLVGICAAANRQAENGEIVSAGQPDQRLSVEDAIALYTTSASRAAGLASVTGSLAPGKDADLVLLSRNPCCGPPEKIKEIEVRLTMARGKIVWTPTRLKKMFLPPGSDDVRS
jgi:predicted amidohydrolase YtcJ